MNKYLFIEYNKPGMEWLSADESPRIITVEAATPQEAFQEWRTKHARYFSEEHVGDSVANIDSIDEFYWGVRVKMFHIQKDYSSLPLQWLKATAAEFAEEFGLEA